MFNKCFILEIFAVITNWWNNHDNSSVLLFICFRFVHFLKYVLCFSWNQVHMCWEIKSCVFPEPYSCNMSSVKDFRKKVIITWHQVKRKLYMGYVFTVRTFDFGQTHVKEELELILALVCLRYGQPDYLNKKHICHSELLKRSGRLFHCKYCSLMQQIHHLWDNFNHSDHQWKSGKKKSPEY